MSPTVSYHDVLVHGKIQLKVTVLIRLPVFGVMLGLCLMPQGDIFLLIIPRGTFFCKTFLFHGCLVQVKIHLKVTVVIPLPVFV